MYVLITTLANFVQPPNAPLLEPPCLPSNTYLNVVSVDGMVMLVKPVLVNTDVSSTVTKGGNVNVVKLVLLKQESPIVTIVGGNEMLVRFVQPLNADGPTPVTVYVVPSITKLSNMVIEDNDLLAVVPLNTSAVPSPILYP